MFYNKDKRKNELTSQRKNELTSQRINYNNERVL